VIGESRDAEFFEDKFNKDIVEHSNPIIEDQLMRQMKISKSSKRHYDAPIEPRWSQRKSKEKSLRNEFFSSQAFVFLVERDRTSVTHKIPIVLDVKEEDPKTFSEAMTSRDASFWKEGIEDEMNSILSNNTWVLRDLPPRCKPIKCKGSLKRKQIQIELYIPSRQD